MSSRSPNANYRELADIASEYADEPDPVLAIIADTPHRELTAAVRQARTDADIADTAKYTREYAEFLVEDYWVEELALADKEINRAESIARASERIADISNKYIMFMVDADTPLTDHTFSRWMELKDRAADRIRHVAEQKEKKLELQIAEAAQLQAIRNTYRPQEELYPPPEVRGLVDDVETVRLRLTRFGRSAVLAACVLVPTTGAGCSMYELTDESQLSSLTQWRAVAATSFATGVMSTLAGVVVANSDRVVGKMAQSSAKRHVRRSK